MCPSEHTYSRTQPPAFPLLSSFIFMTAVKTNQALALVQPIRYPLPKPNSSPSRGSTVHRIAPFHSHLSRGTAGTSHGAPSTKWTRTELQRAWRRTAQMLPCYRCISVQRDCAHFWAPYGKKAEMLKVSLASVPQEQTDPRGTQVDRYECENAAQP